MVGRLVRWGRSKKLQILFASILFIGIFARIWEFGSLPPGLHQDEASIGVEAYYLYHYGVDRNNVSFPIHFISWGNGQNAPYAYLMIPLIALFGLSVSVVRLPILLSGIATLPIVYFIFRRTVDERFGLLAMFCIAISPWHILLSRWGLESNLLPFFFSAGYLLLLKARDDWRWFIPANILFALCFYTYGTAYAFLPLFLLAASIVFLKLGVLNIKQIALGFLTLTVFALPLFLFLAINFLHFDSLHIGPVTIPRLPTLPRFQEEGVMFNMNVVGLFIRNFNALVKLLIYQDDYLAGNIFPPYGYFYQITFPLAILGIWALTRTMQQHREEKFIWLGWLASALILGTLQQVVINRINVIFIPLIGSMAYFVYWLSARVRSAIPVAVATLLIAFSFFTYGYHTDAYRLEAEKKFFTGFLPALRFAQEQSDGPICISRYRVMQPYIFVLFTERIPPAQIQSEIQYHQPITPLREVDRLGRYTFGLENCGQDSRSTYILFHRERPQEPGNYEKRTFDYFTVYVPKDSSAE